MVNFLKLTGRLASVLVVAGCATQTKIEPAMFSHADHGVVTAKHPAYAADSRICGEKAYAAGVMMHGRRITSREEARRIHGEDMVEALVREYRGAGAMAGWQGAMAVSTGNMSYVNNPSSTASSRQSLRFPYSDELKQREADYEACMREKGWQRVKKG